MRGQGWLSKPSGSVGSITDWRSNNPHPCLHPAFPREGDAYGKILPHPFPDGLESHPCLFVWPLRGISLGSSG